MRSFASASSPGFKAPLEECGAHALILFDGVCTLCNGAVNVVIDHDPDGYFKLAALQSEKGRVVLEALGVANESLDSIVLVEDGVVYRRSTAALQIARRLSGAWPLLYGLIAVPPPIRDAVYNWIVRNRYAWFGQRDQCRRPTPELMERFL